MSSSQVSVHIDHSRQIVSRITIMVRYDSFHRQQLHTLDVLRCILEFIRKISAASKSTTSIDQNPRLLSLTNRFQLYSFTESFFLQSSCLIFIRYVLRLDEMYSVDVCMIGQTFGIFQSPRVTRASIAFILRTNEMTDSVRVRDFLSETLRNNSLVQSRASSSFALVGQQETTQHLTRRQFVTVIMEGFLAEKAPSNV